MPILAAFVLLAATAPVAPVQPEPPKHRRIENRKFQLDDLKRAKLTIDGNKFDMWVMDTYAKRQEGMMFLENTDFKDDEGMVFVFRDPDYQRFWMHNTLVPLDIAYVGPNLRVLNTYTMKALDETTDYSSWGKAGIVIEARAGMFRKLGIGRGDKVEIPKTLRATE